MVVGMIEDALVVAEGEAYDAGFGMLGYPHCGVAFAGFAANAGFEKRFDRDGSFGRAADVHVVEFIDHVELSGYAFHYRVTFCDDSDAERTKLVVAAGAAAYDPSPFDSSMARAASDRFAGLRRTLAVNDRLIRHRHSEGG